MEGHEQAALDINGDGVTDKITHSFCVRLAAEYLSKRCNVVLPEFFCFNSELPDVIGFNNRQRTVVFEIKVSRSDFFADRKKTFRIKPEKGMGDSRYFVVPKGLVKINELPKGWGLIYIYANNKLRTVKESYWPPDENADLAEDWKRGGAFPKNIDAEMHLLYYYARRANYAGVHKTILEYRGFDK